MTKPKRTTRSKPKSAKQPSPVKMDEKSEDVFDVEMIVDKRESPKGAEYYVKWRGYPTTANTWEPVENILNPDLISKYEKRQAEKRAALITKSTPIRGNIRFSPSPRTPKIPIIKKSKVATKLSIAAAAAKRRSMSGMPVKTTKARTKAPTMSRSRRKPAPKKEINHTALAEPEKEAEDGADNELDLDVDEPMLEDEDEDVDVELKDVEDDKDVEIEEEKVETPTPKRGKLTKIKLPIVNKTESKAKLEKPIRKVTARIKRDTKPTSAAGDEPMDFSKFVVDQMIDESKHSKSITFKGTCNNLTTVIRLEKTAFDEESIKKALSNTKTVSQRHFSNDIYASYNLTPHDSVAPLNNISATVVCPANKEVLAKYSHSETILFSESSDTYLKVVEPYIAKKLATDKDYNNWVYNILEGRSEVDRVILNDPDPDSGFMIIRDLKWSGDNNDVCLLAICHRRDIRSIRDLNDQHLTLLKNIMTKGTKAIKDKFKKVKGQLRSYIHYHPSFYHFHVHFKMIDASDYQATDRDNLLGTVINNISLNKDHYRKSTLAYPLKQDSSLYQELKKAKRV